MDFPDHELLARFSKNRDERAFRLIVTRYLPLVLSVARRQGLAEDLASDVAQQVFVLLAQRPESIRPQEKLVAWFHCVSRSLAIRMWRAEKQRFIRESKAFHAMQDEAPSISSWEALSPFIDEAISRLAPVDRGIILMRFYEGLSLGAVAKATGLSEEAIRKRITRGLERVRSALGKKGITTTAVTLATQLPLYSVTPAPAGLVASVCSSALSAGAPTLTTFLASILITMTTSTKLIIGGVALSCLLIGTIAVIPRSDSSKSISSQNAISGDSHSGATPIGATRSSSDRSTRRSLKSPKRAMPLDDVRESLEKSKLGSASFSDLGAKLADNFDLLGLTDSERIAVLQVTNDAKKQLVEAEAKLLEPEQSTPSSISIDLKPMEAEAEKIKDYLKTQLASALPEDVSSMVVDSINWDNYYYNFSNQNKIEYSLSQNSTNERLSLSIVQGNTTRLYEMPSDKYPSGTAVNFGTLMEGQAFMMNDPASFDAVRLGDSVLKNFTLTPP